MTLPRRAEPQPLEVSPTSPCLSPARGSHYARPFGTSPSNPCRDARTPRAAAGFTLLEMLVAIALFALASALAYGGLDALLRARRQLDAEQDRLARLQLAIGLIERDVRGFALRPVRDAYGAPQPALIGTRERLELTRGGYANALQLPRAELERVAWRVQDGSLQRLRWTVLDRTPGSAPVEDALLDGVERIDWTYLAQDGREHAQWPPPRGAAGERAAGVVLMLRLSGIGEIRRVLELPPEPAS